MRAGRLRHRIAIQQQVKEQDASGNLTTSWAAVADNVPAEMVPLSGRELIAAQATQSEINTRCTIRVLAGVTAAMRVVHEGAIYNIQAPPLPDPTYKRHLTLMLSGGLSDGR
ncbi:MAG: phage head closure protein [Solimonas sp.]